MDRFFRFNGTGPRNDAMRAHSKLILVWGFHNGFDAQGGLGRDGIRHYREDTALEAMMTLTVVCHLDGTSLAWFNWIAGIVAHRAAATRLHATDNQRHVTRVCEMKRIGHHLALQHGAKVVRFRVELDGRLFVGRLSSRLGAGHQIGGELAFTFAFTRRQCQHPNQGSND